MDIEDLKVWVCSGGRCVLCKTYLLESDLTLKPVLIGEVAHNVGRKRSARSPRGMSAMPVANREMAENKLLLCPTCHVQVDKLLQVESFPEEWLRQRKQEHESEVRKVTGLVGKNRTVILRMLGTVRSAPVELSPYTAAAAVLAAGRIPSDPLSPDGMGVEIDLMHTAGEHDADDAYFEAAARQIDVIIERRLRPAVEKDGVRHLSVFAIARLPLLVYLGSRLDDIIPTDIYQRHRSTESWTWPDAVDTEFAFHTDRRMDGSEAALIVNASGSIQPAELPDVVSDFPRFTIEPVSGTPHPDTVATPATLSSFSSTLRALLADLEKNHKQIRKLHVFAAAPVSVAVTLGRATGWGIHPTLAVYERTNEATYRPGMEVTAP